MWNSFRCCGHIWGCGLAACLWSCHVTATTRVMDELSACLIEEAGVDECAEREEKEAVRGSYGFVFKVTVQGVERIGKKLHSAYVNNVSAQDKQAITSRFRNECVILSKLRHPNIVQFIGVHYGRRGKTDLTLIMECVSSDMHKFLEGHPNLPLPVKLSILLDVSYGLVYLHEWDPNTPIVHRDLTARNVLITDKCQAKIADVGMAKVVDIQAQMADSHTRTPGQMFYMPPEALKEKASCTPKLDIFSFGHLTLFTVNQEFPEVYDVTQTSDMQRQGNIQRCRRRTALDNVGDDHCLYSVITDCLSDQPENRPTTRILNNRMIHLSTSTLNPAGVESVFLSKSDCGNPQCKVTLTELIADHEAEAARLKATVEEMSGQVRELKLELAISEEEVGEIACAKAESDIYRSDFFEERKDRERAQGALDSLQKEVENRDRVFKEELAIYREQIESSNAKFAHAEAKHQEEMGTSKATIQSLKSKVEEISRERDDWKCDSQQRKKAVGDRSRELAKVETQLQHSTAATVGLMNKVDRLRQEKRERQKALSKAEARNKPQNKRTLIQDSSVPQTATGESTGHTDLETLYEEERERNQVLQDEIGYMNDDIKHHKSVIVKLKSMIASPGDDSEKTLVSPTTKTESDPLQVPGESDTDVGQRLGSHSVPSNSSVFTSTYQEQKRQGSFVQPLHPMENHANGSGETTTLLTRSQRLLGGVVGFITGTSKNEVEALETPDSELDQHEPQT